jgi:hypothetical protein
MAVSVDALARKVEELSHATSHDSDQIQKIIAAIRELMTPLGKPRREIGFHTRPEQTCPAAKRRKNRES